MPSLSAPPVGTYQLLEKIPGSTFDPTKSGKLNVYLQDIYNFAFWAVGIAVVFMLTIGGFLYLTSAGNTSRLGTAKTIIFDAFLGLILALVAWMFLNLINPELVKMNLPTSVTVNPTIRTVTSGGTGTGLASTLMTAPGVTINNTGSCSADISGATTPVSPELSLQQQADGKPVTACQSGCPGSGLCTAQTTLSETMLNALIALAGEYPYTITSFSGGSHSGGSSHYSGRAVDLVPAAVKADWPSIATFLRSKGGWVICDIPNPAGGSMQVKCDSPEANHIHAQW
ncbi:MAG: pilin [Undibacterium sp.]